MSNPQKVGTVGTTYSPPCVPTYVKVGTGGNRWEHHRSGILVECGDCGAVLSERCGRPCKRCRFADLQADHETERAMLKTIPI